MKTKSNVLSKSKVLLGLLIISAMTVLDVPAFAERTFTVSAPDKAEQEVIGQFFMLFDNLIMRQQKKCEKYKMVKQGMVEELLTGKVRLV